MSAAFDDLIQRAYRRRRTLASVIVEDCLERLPHYRGIPAAMQDEIRESSDHHLAILYRVTLLTGRRLTDADLSYSKQLARKRAVQGVPLGSFLTFFLVGLTRAWEDLITSAGDDPALRAQLLDRVTAVISNQTQLMSTLTEVYVEERERLSRFQEQDLDDFVQLLLGDETVPALLEARATALGIKLDELTSVAIFGPITSPEGAGTSVGSDDLEMRLAARMPRQEIRVGRSREGFVALLPEPPDPKVLAAAAEGLLRDDARVGIGSPGAGPDGLRRSAGEAVRALRIALQRTGTERVAVYDDVAVLDLIGLGSAASAEFADRTLGRLTAPDANPVYLETLRALAAHNFGIKLAAAELDVHPHTLSYRTKQLQRRFGLDLDEPEIRLRVQLALRVLAARSPSATRG